jgi:NAD(P)-dependent dehydrogenase (short-subunit alcohol dehydrogenase family)
MAYEGFDLTGRTALVTGGNSGIGLGMADALARAGCDVCIWGSNPEKNEQAFERLQAHGTRVGAIACDVADEADVERAFAETVEGFGRVDGVFANAGVSGRAGTDSFAAMTTEEWRRVLSVNLDGAFFTLRAACRHFIEHGQGGRIVGMASLAAQSGVPRGQHYAASKGAMVSMIYALAVEMARHGVTANAILPGWIETPMTERLFEDDRFADAVGRRIPVRRWGDGSDFGGIAVYLMSPASAYHTGDTFVIDGGYQRF